MIENVKDEYRDPTLDFFYCFDGDDFCITSSDDRAWEVGVTA